MKTKTKFTQIFVVVILTTVLLSSCCTPRASQLRYDSLDNAYEDFEYQPRQTLAAAAGFAWKDNDGDGRTSFCLGSEYLYRVNNPQDRDDCGTYLGGFANYHYGSRDDFNKSVFKVGPRFQLHMPINRAGDLQLVTGAQGQYSWGTEENFGFKDDITGYGGNLFSGFNMRLGDKWSLGLHIPIVNYTSTTFKQQDGNNEFTQDRFSLGLNKRNPVMASVRFNLGMGRASGSNGDL